MELSNVEELADVEGLAKVLKVKSSWVYSQTRKTGPNSIPRIKVGKYLRFVLDDVFKWLQEQNQSS